MRPSLKKEEAARAKKAAGKMERADKENSQRKNQ
jgi:hypothetical protein